MELGPFFLDQRGDQSKRQATALHSSQAMMAMPARPHRESISRANLLPMAPVGHYLDPDVEIELAARPRLALSMAIGLSIGEGFVPGGAPRGHSLAKNDHRVISAARGDRLQL